MKDPRRWVSSAVSAAVLLVVAWRLGTGPLIDGLKAVDSRALLGAAAIVLVTTAFSAWRWTIVTRGLGVPLSLPDAVAAYYEAVFLNLTLPTGVAGDVHRAIRHGRAVRDLSRAMRAVVWERAAGQVVQAAITVAVLLVLPSPVRSSMPVVVAALGAAAIGVVLVARVSLRPTGSSRWARARDAVAGDLRDGVVRRGALPAVVLASAVVVLGHAATFLIAARTAGATAPASRMLPLALLAMLAMVLPSVAGWGPREGVTAWAFAAAGLGADVGVATAVVYGVMSLVASLPGALVLLGAAMPGAGPRRSRAPLPVVIRRDGGRDA